MKKLLSFFALTLLTGLLARTASAQDNAAIIRTITTTMSPVDTTGVPYVPNGKVNFQLFTDYAYKIAGGDTNGSAALKPPYKAQSVSAPYYQAVPKTFQAFDVRRLYFGYDYNFNRDVTGQMLLASEPAALDTSGTNGTIASQTGPFNGDGTRGVYVKLANVQWKNIFPYAKLTFGQQAPPTFVPFTEMLWAYRSIEKTIMDMRGIGSSTDLGIQLSGRFDASGDWGYNAMIGNGSNKKPEFDKYKKYYASVNGFLLDRRIAVEAYVDYNPLSDSTHYMTWKLFAAWLWDPASIGVEYVQQPAVATVSGAATDQDPTGLSLWARGKIVGNTLGYFARYDMWNPDSKYTKAYYKEGFFTAGLDWQPAANLHIEPNIWMESYSAQNGATAHATDLVGRLTLFTKIP